jgi:hypothetical protein
MFILYTYNTNDGMIGFHSCVICVLYIRSVGKRRHFRVMHYIQIQFLWYYFMNRVFSLTNSPQRHIVRDDMSEIITGGGQWWRRGSTRRTHKSRKHLCDASPCIAKHKHRKQNSALNVILKTQYSQETFMPKRINSRQWRSSRGFATCHGVDLSCSLA